MFKCLRTCFNAEGRGAEVNQLSRDYEIALYQFSRNISARISLKPALIQGITFLGQSDGKAVIVTAHPVKRNDDHEWIVGDEQTKGKV
ncbi:MAG: hypothetical protein V1844_22455 [Pseudomonadota bacterium]